MEAPTTRQDLGITPSTGLQTGTRSQYVQAEHSLTSRVPQGITVPDDTSQILQHIVTATQSFDWQAVQTEITKLLPGNYVHLFDMAPFPGAGARKQNVLHYAILASPMGHTQNAEFEVLRRNTVRVLIQHVPADSKSKILNQGDFLGRTPLHLAADCKFADSVVNLVQLLLYEDSVLVNTPDASGQIPLHYAARNPVGASITKLLIEKGAKVFYQDHNGQTPLHHAASVPTGAYVLQQLIGAGGHINGPDHEGRSPLHIAAASLSAQTTRVLLDHGANHMSYDTSLCTPADRARASATSSKASKESKSKSQAVQVIIELLQACESKKRWSTNPERRKSEEQAISTAGSALLSKVHLMRQTPTGPSLRVWSQYEKPTTEILQDSENWLQEFVRQQHHCQVGQPGETQAVPKAASYMTAWIHLPAQNVGHSQLSSARTFWHMTSGGFDRLTGDLARLD